MKIQLSDNFNYSKLIKFTFPSALMIVITSVYGVVDGLFVSNYAGKTAFAALTLIFPVIMIIGAFGFMISTGGCALIGKYLGEKKEKKANEIFSFLLYILISCAIIFSGLAIIFLRKIAIMLGATPELLEGCITYGTILLIAMPAFILQIAFQAFVVVANKPNMGFILSIFAGVTNVLLDYIFIAVFSFGLVGAAIATGISQVVAGVIPLIYFMSSCNNSNLHLVKFKWNLGALIKSCSNGASEMLTSLSLSFIAMLYNLQLMKFLGVNGVTAYGITMYVNFIFLSVFIGYAIGVSPIISYHYGAKNHDELKSLLKKSLILQSIIALILTLIAQLFAPFLAKFFVGYDVELVALSAKALRIFAISYLISYINIFASAFFTALNNGLISGLISFLRIFVFQAIMVFILPYIFGVNGIWSSIIVAEILTVIITIILTIKNNKKYNYL